MFDSWQSFVTFLESVQGNFYYDALLLMLLFIVAIVLQTRAKPARLDWRINLALGSLIGLRLILVATFGYFWITGLSIPAAIAPVERTFHIIGILLFAWIWSRSQKESAWRQASMALASIGLLGLFLYITLPWLDIPTGRSFNYTNLDYLWSAACLVVLVIGAWATNKGGKGRFGLIQLGILFVGQIVHLLLAEPYGNLPLATQAANLIAIPFLFWLPVKEDKKDIALETESFFPKEVPVYEIPESSEKGYEPPPHSPETEDLARETANEMQSDVCAFGALDEALAEVQIHAGYNTLLQTPIALATVQLGELPRLAATLIGGQSLRLSSDQKIKDLDTLVKLLKLSLPGNLLVAPIPNSRDKRIWFVILMRMEKPWQLKEEVNLGKIADELGGKLIQTLGYLEEDFYALEPVINPSELPDERLAGPEYEVPGFEEPITEFNPERQRLEEENERFKQDVARLLAHIDELEAHQGSGSGPAATQSELVTALQEENEQLKNAVGSFETGPGRTPPGSPAVEQTKEELRLALMQVSVLQEKLQAAQDNFSTDGPLQVQSKRDGANQVKVLSSIAQEIKQPLSSVLGYTDLLLSESAGVVGALQQKFLERVRSSSERMNALIGDLIHIAELNQSGLSEPRQPVEIGGVINDAIGQIKGEMQEKHVAMQVDLTNQLPALNTNRDALQQIIYHLLKNAGSVTPPQSSVTVRAVIDSQPDFGEFILLQVSDSGGGISDEDLPRIFSPIFGNTKPSIKGIGETGTGLSIAETLTQALGGRIWVESQMGVGATFSVLLPVQA